MLTTYESIIAGFIIIIITCAGFYAACLFWKKRKFSLVGYSLLLAAPICSIFILSYLYGIKVFAFFLISSIAGVGLEYLFGFAYHKTFNEYFWEYKHFSIGGYTSFMVAPAWGIVAVYFWILSRAFGI